MRSNMTPVTRKGLEKFDHLPPSRAVVAALRDPGPMRQLHADKLAKLAREMPVLYRALVRLAKEETTANDH